MKIVPKIIFASAIVLACLGWGWGFVVLQEKKAAQARIFAAETEKSLEASHVTDLDHTLSRVCVELKIFRMEIARMMQKQFPDRYPLLDEETIGRAYMKNRVGRQFGDAGFDACAGRGSF